MGIDNPKPPFAETNLWVAFIASPFAGTEALQERNSILFGGFYRNFLERSLGFNRED